MFANKIFLALCGVLVVLVLSAVSSSEKITILNMPEDNFNQEDKYIALAYNALDVDNKEEAKEYFKKAFEISKDGKYLEEIIGILMLEKKYEDAKKVALESLQKNPKNTKILAAYIGILTSLKDYKEAQKYAEILIKIEKNAENYEIASSVYFLLKDYKKSVEYLEKSYALEKDVEVLDKLASIEILFLKNRKKGIALYETHHRFYGITPITGEKLAAAYIDSKEYLKAGKVFEALYANTQRVDYAKVVLEIYFKMGYFKSMQTFLEKNPNVPMHDEMLLEVYQKNKENKKLIRIIQKLYEKNQNPNLLAWEAMLLYEDSKNKSTKLLKEVSQKLRVAIEATQDPLYYNYLGYLLIDHNIDIKEGIAFVEIALEEEPENPYYLDSLAWGYYKLKDCKRAKEVMKKIPKKDLDEEIKKHHQAILYCK